MRYLIFSILLLSCSNPASENPPLEPNEAFVNIFVSGFDNSDTITLIDIRRIYETELDSSFIYADTTIFVEDNNRLVLGSISDIVISVDANKNWFLESIN